MCEPTTILAIGGAVLSAKGAYDQGQVAQQVGRNNAQMAEYAAQDAQKRGEEEASAIQRRAASLKSSQRVNLASKGLDLGYGTAADLQDQVDFFGQSDAATARTNAARDAWSMRARGQNERAQGDAAARTGTLQAFGTMLSAGGHVADKWYQRKSGTVPRSLLE